MNLFEMTPNGLQIQPEAYSLGPFKAIWDRDKTKNKDKAISELAYIYFMVDYTSDYADIENEEERGEEIKKSLPLLTKTWAPDELVQNAIDFYKGRQETVALRLLEDAKSGVSKLSQYMRNINFNETEVTNSGEVKPKHDIKKFADTIRQIPAIIGALKELEDTVKKEREAEKGLRGGRTKGDYVD